MVGLSETIAIDIDEEEYYPLQYIVYRIVIIYLTLSHVV